MQTYYTDPSVRTAQLVRLGSWQRIAFGWVLACHLRPIYHRFAEEFFVADGRRYDATLHFIRNCLLTGYRQPVDVDEVVRSVESMEPEAEDKYACGYEVISALAVLWNAVKLCRDAEVQFAVQAANHSFQAVEDVSEIEGQSSTSRDVLVQQPAVQRELSFQLALLKRIEALDETGQTALDELGALSIRGGDLCV